MPGDPTLTYRYCVFAGGKFDRWEDKGNIRRTLELEKTKSLTKQTEDSFGIESSVAGASGADIAPVRFLATEKQSQVKICVDFRVLCVGWGDN